MENLILLNPSSTKNILVVEDHVQTLKALALLIQPLANVTAVESGNKAIELLKIQSFDMVLTDYEMRDGNGMHLLKFISENKINTPVVIITSKGSKELALEAIKYQIFGFLEKPLVREDIEKIVEAGLQKKTKDENTKDFAKVGETASELLHDIANPLALIDIKAEQMKEQATVENDAPMLANAEKLLKSSSRIQNLIKTAKEALKKGKSNTNFKIFSMNDVLVELKEACSAKAAELKVPVVISPDKNVNIYGDKEQLLRVFVNLINNSIDAIADNEEKWVHLEVQKKFRTIEIKITDSGLGIPEAVRDKIFEPLFTTKGAHGTGLGLKIVSDIIKSHGGLISLNSKSVNTQFVLSLPIAS